MSRASVALSPNRPSDRPVRRSPPLAHWARRLVLGVLVAGVLLVGVTAFRVWQVGRLDQHPRSDAIVVLGASQFNGRPSEVLAARLDHAKALYDEHVAPRIVTVGGNQAGDRFTEGQAGANYLARRGVPRSALLAVGVGNDTLASLQGAQTVFAQRGWHSAVLVSDPWHLLRARTMARDLGLSAASSPVHSGPAVQGRGTELHYIGRETLAYLAYEIVGGTSDPGPAAV